MLGRKGRGKDSKRDGRREPDRPWTVLLAGDNADSVELLSRLLAVGGHEVTLAGDRLEVLGKLARLRPQCVVFDMTRGGGADGMHLLEAIRSSSDPEIARVPVIITGARNVNAIFAWSNGADEVLRRPFRPEKLMRAVDAAVVRSDDTRPEYRRQNRNQAMSEPGLGALPELEPSILVVCTANICRSPMATAILQRLLGTRADISSAGTITNAGQRTAPDTVAVLAERGITLAAAPSRQLTADLVQGASLVLTMERAHVAEAVALTPGVFPRVFTLPELVRRGEERGARQRGEPMSAWLSRLHEGRMASDLVRPAGKGASDEVADPYGRSRNAYRKCAGELEDLLKRFVALAFPG